MSNKRFETRVYTDGTTATGPVPLPEQSPRIKHDYPACAIFRGGKCTCDEADKLCPRCGLDQWDTITAERGRERDVPFNRCIRCDYEWPTTDAEPEPHTQLSDEDLADCGLLSEFCTEDHPDHPIDLQLTGEIVAMRGDFDGYGYRYIDGGSGSDWRTRNPDWEPLVLPMLAAAPEAPAQGDARKDRMQKVRDFIQADADLARGIASTEAPAQGDPMEKLTRIQEELGLYNDKPAVVQVPQEFDYKHPRAQALIGADARHRIIIDLVWQILEDPSREFTASDMEYWDKLHDKVQQVALAASEAQAIPAPWREAVKVAREALKTCERRSVSEWEVVDMTPKIVRAALAQLDALEGGK